MNPILFDSGSLYRSLRSRQEVSVDKRVYYAIKHVPSGALLPLPPELSHGFTRVEPSDKGVPRLFLSEVTAQRALGQWLRGAVTLRTYGTGEDYETEFSVEQKPARKPEDMLVVAVRVTSRREPEGRAE